MKKILSYLVLCVYASIMIKPVMPTITDVFAHVLNYKEHIATVHQHNGKFHVHNDYIEAAKRDSKQDSPCNNTLKKTGGSDEHTLFPIMPVFSLPLLTQQYQYHLSQYLPRISLQENLRPPISVTA